MLLNIDRSPQNDTANHNVGCFVSEKIILMSCHHSQPPSWPFPEYSHGTPPEGYPDMDFLAPEYALESECTTASDMFSLGMVAFALYNTKPLFVNSGNWGVYKRNASEVNVASLATYL